MPQDPIHSDLVRIALDKAEGSDFERFVNDFFPAVAGGDYVPLGGYKDGGADGLEEPIYERTGSIGSFYQASVERDVSGKIARTVERLKAFGREPRRLVLVTPTVVKYLDTVESDLTDSLDVTIVIRDGAYIAAHVNDSPQSRAAFNTNLRHLTSFLSEVGASNLIPASVHVNSPAVFVFLGQEIARRGGDGSLADAVTDSLVLWALEGTDPEKGLLRSADEVRERISEALPSVIPLVGRTIHPRLQALSKKSHPNGRGVNWHRKEDAYCLPLQTRQTIEAENAEDVAVQLAVADTFRRRAASFDYDGIGPAGKEEAVAIALRALQVTFEREGLEFASFVSDPTSTGGYATISDSIRKALAELGPSGKRGSKVGALAADILRGTFYNSEPCEREYLEKLSKTYALLFTLNTEPRLIQYFQEMTGRFYLYVGSDLLITALSEHCLAPPDQITRNTLLMATRQGAKLILTGPVLEEVISHLRACDAEYRNHIRDNESAITLYQARQAPHILLRAYLYSKLAPADGALRKPSNWPEFVQHFCSYPELENSGAMDDLRRYLSITFGMEFRSSEDLLALVDPDAVQRLATSLKPEKHHNERLAWNDALVALAVYGRRRKYREDGDTSEFGYNTWWLTAESSILRHTKALVKERGARYIMRPDFLLRFLALSPNAAEAREAFKNVFPSLLGIQLSRRMSQESFHKLMRATAQASELEPARRAAAMARIADDLKGTYYKSFNIESE